jgi:hypothetical protein
MLAFFSFLASPNCVDFLTSVFPEEPRVVLLDQWQLYKGTLRTPAGAPSARMAAEIAKKEAGGSLVGNHDAVSWRVAPFSSEDNRFLPVARKRPLVSTIRSTVNGTTKRTP